MESTLKMLHLKQYDKQHYVNFYVKSVSPCRIKRVFCIIFTVYTLWQNLLPLQKLYTTKLTKNYFRGNIASSGLSRFTFLHGSVSKIIQDIVEFPKFHFFILTFDWIRGGNSHNEFFH